MVKNPPPPAKKPPAPVAPVRLASIRDVTVRLRLRRREYADWQLLARRLDKTLSECIRLGIETLQRAVTDKARP